MIVNEINEFSISDSSDTDSSEDEYGICEECRNENTNEDWCLQCNSQHFQQNFGNWKSGNKDVDEIIQESQSNCTGTLSFVEWIPYSKFEDIKYIDKGGFGKIYSAIWKEGFIKKWNIQQKQWERSDNEEIALKSLNNSQNITTEFLNEFKNYLICKEPMMVPYFVVNRINEISISNSSDTDESEGEYGICEECGNENTNEDWCLQCNSQHFQQNFGNWKSGNKDVDEIIQESQSNCTGTLSFVEWIPYSKFEDIKYIDKGGFGKIYSAIWKEGFIKKWNIQQKQWERSDNEEIALKSLNNSQNITTEFLNEFKNYLICKEPMMVPYFGIAQDPETKDYLHIGNILSFDHEYCLITDLGLSKPADEISKDDKQKVFGVIPYIAPEVLSGDDNYSTASDVYSFAMIMFEILTGIPPFYNIPHDKDLALKIYIMKRYWDAKSEQRPTIKELLIDFENYTDNIGYKVKESIIYKEIEECDRLNLKNPVDSNNTDSLTSYEIAIYTSRCLNFKNLPKPKNLNENDNKNTNELTTKDYQITTEECSIEIPWAMEVLLKSREGAHISMSKTRGSTCFMGPTLSDQTCFMARRVHARTTTSEVSIDLAKSNKRITRIKVIQRVSKVRDFWTQLQLGQADQHNFKFMQFKTPRKSFASPINISDVQ
ncbi:hypothetical protein Glove_162g68 [Diversispora epigaea]|uniref:Protein kinase domain-containing protein n=1 Tax=Diversispora epigaea TaxID=1348612 RepID=A0A397IXQ1_9GLOM|nr:hypothetical protein Glove_162g68 [Diversispora epigaea]